MMSLESKIKESLSKIIDSDFEVKILYLKNTRIINVYNEEDTFHSTRFDITEEGFYLAIANTTVKNQRKGIATAVRLALNEFVKENKIGKVYFDEKELLPDSNYPNNENPLRLLWQKLVNEGKAVKSGSIYEMT